MKKGLSEWEICSHYDMDMEIGGGLWATMNDYICATCSLTSALNTPLAKESQRHSLP